MHRSVDIAEFFLNICNLAFKVRHEEELLKRFSRALQAHVGCDAVIVRLMERYIQARAVATADGVQVLAVGDLHETWTREDEARWLKLKDGVFCEDVRTAPHIRPAFREHALQIGLVCGFMVPVIREGEIYGQIVYGWRSLVELNDECRNYLRKVSDYVGLALTAFQINLRQQLDPLTGLLNRVGLQRRWEVHSKVPMGTLFFADLDNFKDVNDLKGHLVGDRLLQEVARVLKTECNPRAEVARYGGDEFVILYPGCDESEAISLRQHLTWVLEELMRERYLNALGLSIGIAHWPEHGTTLEALLHRADMDLYRYKRGQTPSSFSAAPWLSKAVGQRG